MNYLVTGGKGQLGKEVVKLLKEKNMKFTAYDASELDITNKEQVYTILNSDTPDVVLHCAAYTAVDKAEDEGREKNWAVNVEGTRNVAEACKTIEAKLVFISTDYVFDGTYMGEYSETMETNPKNEYGKAKLAGEDIITQLLEKYYIIRTSWVFGEFGNNFVYTMEKLASERNTLTIVNDQIGRPTWTRTLAKFMIHLVEKNQPYGVYHLSNEGQTSWYGFAKEILKDKNIVLKPVTSEEFPQKAYRPKHSVMNLEKARNTGFNILEWTEALTSFKKEDSNE
ncbi:dTDP-4-dehydrorhamnose reductase [Marinilactibacillus psychrotolerans]|uniref:dTDP-4-dehydrorhamnose reductase n=1 Tax=Marinilactibacillus psychrotolerans TaxID=191770 RepID=UPI003884ACB8